jgi:hypothetical protein
MSDSLRKAVADEVKKQQPTHLQNEKRTSRARVLGLFIDECLKNRNISRDQFAKKLDMERELADAVLNGLLPASELNNETLAEIAAVIGHEPNVLRIILGRKVESGKATRA